MTLFTTIVLISFYQILIVHGNEDDDQGFLADSPGFGQFYGSSDGYFNYDRINSLDRRLDAAAFPGDTSIYNQLSYFITDSKMYGDQCELQFSPQIRDSLTSRFLVGTLNQINVINSVKLAFYNANNDPILDNDDQPIQYTSSPHDLGHILEILQSGFDFSYAKCFLNLQPNSNFNLKNLFFHFSQSLTINKMPLIIGSTLVYTDTIARMYNVSINCRLGSTCMWMLDNDVISSKSKTSVLLIFEEKHLGNRTLSYVAFIGNNPQVLASLLLSILPMAGAVCRCLPRRPKDIFQNAGSLNVPRVHFTATYLPANEAIMIIGGTADGSTPLSSVEIYDLKTGCINIFNLAYARMQHTTTYYNSSDSVIVIGGLNSTGGPIEYSELVSISGAQIHRSMMQARYLHAIANLNSSDIVIVGGRGFNDITRQVETCSRLSALFQLETIVHPQLNNLEGHSVTSLGDSGSVLIFGGFNGTAYFGTGLLYDGTNFTIVGLSDPEDPNTVDPALVRAHHQATYIPSIDAVLITGGDNGNQTLSSCYLYYCSSQTFNATNPMKIARSAHAAVLINNNIVLVTGGAVDIQDGKLLTSSISVERYDASTSMFAITAPLTLGRSRHVAVVVSYNEVFVFGGIGGDGKPIATVEYIMLTIWTNDRPACLD